MSAAREAVLTQLQECGVIAIVRALRGDQINPICEALLEGGIPAVEVTMSTPDAIAAIADSAKRFGHDATIGVGTILDETTGRRALDSGARFLVSPIARGALVPIAHEYDAPTMLGAFTPTEAQMVYESGSDCVKLFPADPLGPSFVKALRAPMPHLKIVPTGGVTPDTVAPFLAAGCVALGAGSSLVSKEILASDDWPELTRRARRFRDSVDAFRASAK